MAKRQPGKRPSKQTKAKVVRPPPRRASTAVAVTPQVVAIPSSLTPPADLVATLAAIRDANDPTATPQSKRAWSAWLRRVCGLLVIGDDLERSVVQWHREHFSDLISLVSFQKWATADGWLRQREERLSKFREAVERQIGTENVRAFVDDLRKLDALHADLGEKLSGRGNTITEHYTKEDGTKGERVYDIVPRAFEKRAEAVTALVALDRRRDEKRKGVLGGLPAALGTGAGNPQVTVTTTISLSPHVARAMARAKLVAERDEVEGKDADEGDDEE